MYGVFGQLGKFLRQFGQFGVHRPPVAFDAPFKAYGNAFEREGVSSAFVGQESMVADVLAIWFAVDIKVERLRQRLPFVAALEGYKMFSFEPLYHLETIADIIIRKVGGLRVGYRAGGA